MAYFSSKEDRVERGAKIIADIASAVLLASFSVVFFGLLFGLVAFALVEACILAVNWLVPTEDAASTAVR